MHKPLEILNLSKNYGAFKAVDDVSFALEEGEIFGLLGPNGAGKTTLISCVVTLENMTSGKVKVFGDSILDKPKETKSKIGYVPQEVVNHGYFTVEEILKFYSGFFGILRNQEKIDYLLNRLSLDVHRNKKVKQLSGGMKRRLMIAKALVHDPKILLLDEPTAGVDIELRNSLWDFVVELKKSGTTVLLTTHYLEEAEELCDRIGVIHNGSLRKVGRTSDLIQDLTLRKLEMQLSGKNKEFNSKYLVSQCEESIELEFPSNLEIGEVVKDLDLDWSTVKDIHLKEGSLEEAFLRILNENNANNSTNNSVERDC